MKTFIFENKDEMGAAAAHCAAGLIKDSIKTKGSANIILATGASQFEMLANLVSFSDIDWSKVRMFHLDGYIGISETHPASFKRYLRERFVKKVPSLKMVCWVEADKEDPEQECRRLGDIILAHPIDVAMVGFGENGHLAFNDPPADFETEKPYIVVALDKKCRQQQVGEGWFKSLDEVPTQAVSMSIKQIMKSKYIVTTVPDERKAIAVKNALEDEVTNMCPASILQKHPNCTVFLDKYSSSLLAKYKNQ